MPHFAACRDAVHRETVILTVYFRSKFIHLHEGPLATFLRSEGHRFSVPGQRGFGDNRAFTLLELLIVMAIMITLAAMGIPAFADALEVAYVGRAIGDIRTLQTEITRYEVQLGKLPDTLQEAGVTDMLDPWGNPYQYLNFDNVNGQGQKKKDRFLVPLNSTYDLYSMGKDGVTSTSLQPPASQDDIVRANDGAYVGLGSEF
ncbi:MAG: prepilin-type cleavage/methylation domain-containing protein [Acidobacteriota bacterium]